MRVGWIVVRGGCQFQQQVCTNVFQVASESEKKAPTTLAMMHGSYCRILSSVCTYYLPSLGSRITLSNMVFDERTAYIDEGRR